MTLFFQDNYLQYTSKHQTIRQFLDELLFILYAPAQISEHGFQQFIEHILMCTTEKLLF